MSRYVQPYKGASVEAMASGVVPSGPNAGSAVTITLYRDMASHGYKTGYQAVPKRWYEVCADVKDDRGRSWRQCRSFSGKQFTKGLELFRRDVIELQLTVNINPEGGQS